MRKIWVIAMREYQASVRTKAFIISLIIMPIMMGGGILIQVFLKGDLQHKEFKIIDHTGKLFKSLQAAAKGKFSITEEKLDSRTPTPEQINAARYRLSEEVRQGKIYGFAEIGPDIIDPAKADKNSGIRYQTNSPTYRNFAEWLQTEVNNRTFQIRAEKAGIDPKTYAQIMLAARLNTIGLTKKNEKGAYVEASLPDPMVSILLPLGLIMLMFMVIMVGATPLMQGVVEEKMQRIAEVMLGSVRPFALMMGKLAGMVGVALSLVAVYMTGLYWLASYFGYADVLPVDLLIWFIIYLVLAVLMYGSLFIAVGAACTEIKETQTLLMPIMLLVCIPMFVWFNVVQEPNSPFSMWISLFPPAAPMLMVARLAVPPGIDWWQPVVGVLGVLVTTLGCVFAAGRIFRVGILMQGKAARFTELVRWVFRG
jgi:ABC-2 type transport system permease protein